RDGQEAARQELLVRHESRLRRMISVRMDPRLGTRLDPMDIVQDVFACAWPKLSEYLKTQPLPFYPWLRQLAWERLVKLHEHHIQAQKRSMTRERQHELALPDESVLMLAERLVARGSGPGGNLLRKELRRRVRQALDQLPARDREILVMRYLEQMAMAEIAA